MRLEGMTAIVTGAGSGFGEGIVKRFSEEGCQIVANDIDSDAVGRVVAPLPRPTSPGSSCARSGVSSRGERVSLRARGR